MLGWLLVLCASLSACAIVHPGIDISGASPEMAGAWEGTYESTDSGRRGRVFMALSARGDSAVGEVVMEPPGAPASARYDGQRWVWDGTYLPAALSVTFVKIESGRVRGLLDPYQDPTCGCVLRTTFEGVVSGDRVLGTFESLHSDAPHPYVATLIRQHAHRAVSEFVAGGMDRAHQPTPLPEPPAPSDLTMPSLPDFDDARAATASLYAGTTRVSGFAFRAGQGLPEHSVPGEAYLLVTEGAARVTIGDTPHDLVAGDGIVLPAGVPHALNATEDTRVVLVRAR